MINRLTIWAIVFSTLQVVYTKFTSGTCRRFLQWYDSFFTETYWTIENLDTAFLKLNINDRIVDGFMFFVKRFSIRPFLMYLKVAPCNFQAWT